MEAADRVVNFEAGDVYDSIVLEVPVKPETDYVFSAFVKGAYLTDGVARTASSASRIRAAASIS